MSPKQRINRELKINRFIRSFAIFMAIFCFVGAIGSFIQMVIYPEYAGVHLMGLILFSVSAYINLEVTLPMVNKTIEFLLERQEQVKDWE